MTYEEFDSIEDLMSEAPGGENHGRGDGQPLDVSAQQAAEIVLEEAGFGIVDTSRSRATLDSYGTADAGMVVHRGVLAPGEYVDPEVLQILVEEELGFTYAEIQAVYRQGPLSSTQGEMRRQIDARLLALSRSGGNMTLLADALGWNEKTMDRAIARAREDA